MPALLTFALTCTMCQMGANTVLGWLKAGDTRDDVLNKAVGLCVGLKLQQKHVCLGIIDSHVDILMFIYESRKATDNPLTSDDICYLALYPECSIPGPFYEWKLDLDFLNNKPQPQIPQITKEPTSNMQILHITDVHIEPEYTPGNNALCKDLSCCRKEQGLPDTEGGGAGYWGDYRDCDSPHYAFTNLVQQAAKTHQDIAYVAYTGDSVSHAIWATSIESNRAVISSVLKELKDAFPGKVILPVLGNHEPHPFNAFTAETTKAEIPVNITTNWLYEQSATEWSLWLQSGGANINKGGYYSIEVTPGLLVIGLNNNFCYNYNWWLMLDPVDPASQLKWLAETLLKAEESGQKVHILAHVPGNSPSCIKHWREQYQRILHRFENTIVAQFHGHEHTDYFSIYYDPDDSSRATSVSFIAGSATSYTDVNPCYRVYKIDAEKEFRVLDHETWSYNLTEANLAGADGAPNWKKLYSFNEAYGTQSMLPVDLDLFINKMAGDEELLNKYYKNHVREADRALEKGCDSKCRQKIVCDIVTYNPDDKTKCKALIAKHNTLKSISEIYEAELLAGELESNKQDGEIEEKSANIQLEDFSNHRLDVVKRDKGLNIYSNGNKSVNTTANVGINTEVKKNATDIDSHSENTDKEAEIQSSTNVEAGVTSQTHGEIQPSDINTELNQNNSEETETKAEIQSSTDVEAGVTISQTEGENQASEIKAEVNKNEGEVNKKEEIQSSTAVEVQVTNQKEGEIKTELNKNDGGEKEIDKNAEMQSSATLEVTSGKEDASSKTEVEKTAVEANKNVELSGTVEIKGETDVTPAAEVEREDVTESMTTDSDAETIGPMLPQHLMEKRDSVHVKKDLNIGASIAAAKRKAHGFFKKSLGLNLGLGIGVASDK